MAVDGFRFDLGTILGREPEGFDQRGGFFDAVGQDPVLSRLKLIGEPWDIGPGGIRLVAFRRGGPNGMTSIGIRCAITGRTPMAPRGFRGACAWVWRRKIPSWPQTVGQWNFTAAHDGFTHNDVVSYDEKHNDDNGEDNKDGHGDNRSDNHGVEGPTDDLDVIDVRERQKRNFLATLFLSHGTPMPSLATEFGREPDGQTMVIAKTASYWVHWENLPVLADSLRGFREEGAISLRQSNRILRRESWRDGTLVTWFNLAAANRQRALGRSRSTNYSLRLTASSTRKG